MLMLAKWVMGGRLAAFVTAVILAFVPGLGWASATPVALVILRKSMAEAVWPLAGALLVATLAHWRAGDPSQLGIVLAAVVASLVLAHVRSLCWALLSVTAASALYMVLLLSLAPAHIADLVSLLQPRFDEFLAQMQQAEPGLDSTFGQLDIRQVLIEGMVWLVTAGATAALLLARWLQARLYNPGGFRQEFHALRLSPVVAAVLALMLLLGQASADARLVLSCVAIPMLLAGLALVHGVLGVKRNNGPLLVFFYVALVFTSWLGAVVLVLAAVVDSFVDFRNRIQKRYE